MRKIKSSILEAIYHTVQGLHQAGVMDQKIMSEFDRLCLPTDVEQKPETSKNV